MLQIAFVDNEVDEAYKTLKSKEKNKKDWFPAHSFIASCLKSGLTITDLDNMSFISVMKILFSFISNDEKDFGREREATQADIDKFMS